MLLETLLKIWQNNVGCLLNIYHIFGKVNHLTIKFHGTRNNLLPVLPGNEKDLCHQNRQNLLVLPRPVCQCKNIMRP